MAKFNAQAAARFEGEESLLNESGSMYPLIMFMKGNPRMKAAKDISYHGGFFITKDNLPKGDDGEPVDMTQYGWEEAEFTSSDDRTIEGYSRRSMRISAVNMRQGWSVRDVGVFPFRQEGYKAAQAAGRPSGIVHLLVALEGAEELGPFVITMSGHSQMSFVSRKPYRDTGVMRAFDQTVVEAARQASPGNWAFRAFWMPITASQDKSGKPNFYTAGSGDKSSKIVVPEPHDLPAKWQKVDLDDYYVGDDLLDIFDAWREESEEWKAEWDTARIKEDSPQPKEDDPFNDDDEDLDGLV